MSRVALQLAPEFVDQVCQLVKLGDAALLDDFSYIVLEHIDGPMLSYNITFMTDDEILEEAASDPELEIMKF